MTDAEIKSEYERIHQINAHQPTEVATRAQKLKYARELCKRLGYRTGRLHQMKSNQLYATIKSMETKLINP